MKSFLLFIVGAIIGAAAVYFYCCKDAEDVQITQPKGIITPAQAKVLDQAFNIRHRLISDSILKRPDNRSSWYSLDDVRSYLNAAEKQSKELGYTMSGVRIYLGAHADVGDQVGYTTMFFIPTGSKAIAEGNFNFFNFARQLGGNPDIPGGIGLDMGGQGDPPQANYPQ